MRLGTRFWSALLTFTQQNRCASSRSVYLSRRLHSDSDKGHNKELMEQCQTLNEYAQYVEKVRTYTKEDNLDNAVERAVNECIHDGILADFLTQNKSEVIAMSIFEYDEKAVRQVYYKDGLQAGRKDGIKTGILNMLKTQKYSLEEISEVFQVPVEEIEQIKNQQM